jgi:inosine-uridine nucleoside N-ribohydrolase
MTTRILIDCDPGHDDAIALLLSLASPEVELVGVTTVFGNQTLRKTTANAIRVLELAGRGDIPVASGAERPLVRDPFLGDYVHGESGLDGPVLPPPDAKPADLHAVDFLAERLEPGVVLVATGPLTNVALALERGVRPERIVLMGGSIAEGNVTPAAEFNIWTDPEAAQRVFTAGLDVTMIGLDVTHKALLTPAGADRLRTSEPTGRFVAELYDFYHRFHVETYGWEGSPIHDAVAVAHVARPGLVDTLERHVAIETESELCRGRTVVDLWRRTHNNANALVAVDIDAEAFIALLLERLAAFDRTPRRPSGTEPKPEYTAVVNAREERLARNETMFRAVNREIEQAEEGAGDESLEVLCECGRPDCSGTIELSAADYDRIHVEPDRFVVLPGHATAAIERVVEETDDYLVVDKFGEAEEIAEE